MTVTIRWLRYLNYFFGSLVMIAGILGFVFYNSIPALLLAFALAAVGPIEDILNKKLKLSGIDPAQTKELVNQGTSLTFVIILLIVIFLSLEGL
jgi:uncharacterized Tic20 family protein